MFDNILFDLDGTLTDPFEGITGSVQYALAKFGIDADKNDLKVFIGPPLYASFMMFYGFDEAKALKAVEYYRERFAAVGLYENEVYDGIVPMLQELTKRGKRLAVATSKPEKFAKLIVEHFGLSRYFEVVAGATMDSSRIEKADVVKYALDLMGISDASTAVMVGDREHDIIGAKANGLKSVGVLYGFGDRRELESAGADYIAATPRDIVDMV